MSHDFLWRSMLFVPAHVQRFIESAHTRGADACVLDLEDSVPADRKQYARETLQASAKRIAGGGSAVLVRVNEAWQQAELDLHAAVSHTVKAIVLPKVRSGKSVRAAARRLAELEAQRALPRGHTRLIAQIEDVHALVHLDAIATSCPILIGMILGPEDFSASAGMQPTSETLYWPNQQVLFACRRAGILPFGFPGSIAEFRNLDAFRKLIQQAAQMGFVGAFCVHPSQVSVLNEEFSQSPQQVEEAKEMVAAFEAAAREGHGAIQFRGRMVDAPVVARAREVLSRAGGT